MPRRALSKLLPHLLLISAGMVCLPQKTHEVDFRSIKAPLEIRIEKSSPAYSALEDTRVSYSYDLPKKPIDNVQLKTGPKAPAAAPVFISLEPQVISKFTKLSHVSDITDRKLRIGRAYVEETPEPMTLAQVAQNLIKEELKDQKEKENERILPSGIIIRKPLVVAAAPTSPAPAQKSGKPSPGRVIRPKGDTVLAMNERQAAPSDPSARDTSGNTIVRGKMSFKNGAAYLRGYDTLEITHGYGDIILTQGIWIERDGYFEIPVEKPSGEIIAKVYSREGVLTAEGVLHLADLKVDWNSERRIENADISMLPAKDGVEAVVLAAETRGLPFRTSISNANLEVLGFGGMSREEKRQSYGIKELKRPSSMIIQASIDNFWSSLKLGFAGQRNIINVFSDQTIETLLSVLQQEPDSKDLTSRNIAWGSIYKDGKPLENAVVDLAFNDDEEVIYFSGPIPDRMRVMSDSNGQFVILNKTPGLQLLRVQQIGEQILPALVAFQPKTITDLNLEVSSERQIEFQSYDMFSGQPKTTEFNFLGEDLAFESNEIGYSSLRRRLIEGLTLAEFDGGGNYVMTRVAFNQNTRFVDVPLFSVNWLAGLGVSDSSNLILGKVSGEDYEVSLEVLTGMSAEIKILYFNPDGTLRKEKFGVADGSYLIEGAPAGLQSVTVSSIRSDKQVANLVLADDRAAHYSATTLSN